MRKEVEKKSDGPRKLNLRQRVFVYEKLFGQNDKQAALAAGYSLSVAENTKQKIWARLAVRNEFDRFTAQFAVTRTNIRADK